MAEFSLYDHALHDDPYPAYARLRETAPVFRNETEDFWALSRHCDVAAALPDHGRFSSANGILLEPGLWGPQAHTMASFLAMDPPRHTRMRGLVSRGFTPRRIQLLESRIREIARGHLEPALERGAFDLITDFASHLPVDVICELAGVPPADRAQARRNADLIVDREEGVRDIPAAGIEAAAALWTYFADLIADRRHHRHDDLASALLDAVDGDDHLSEAEITGVLFLLVSAGAETTTHLIGNAWNAAWRHPDQRSAAFGGRIADWIEETLRFDAPSQGIGRTLTEELTLHGTSIPAGARMFLLIGAANRDPDVFAAPDRFDLDRRTRPLVSFGDGRHYCLGANLARLEARIALEELTALIVDYDIDEASATRVHSAYVRGFNRLPTTVSRR